MAMPTTMRREDFVRNTRFRRVTTGITVDVESARVEEGDDDDGRNSWSASFGVAWIVVFYLTVMVCAALGICHVAQDHPLSDLLLPLAYLGGLCDVTLVGVAWCRAAAFADPLNG